MTRALAVLVALGALAAACGQPARHWVIATSDPAEYPCVLREPRTIPHDFMVRQHLTIRAVRNGEPIAAELDAVLQKQGDMLVVVGFGPMNVKVFTLAQRGDRIQFDQHAGPRLPFSPRDIVVDVHRVYFKRLPAPAAGFSGVHRGELDGERVEETWRDGELRASVFTRPGSALRGAIRVERGAGCGPSRCEPVSATLSNEWFGYTLAIANDDYEGL